MRNGYKHILLLLSVLIICLMGCNYKEKKEIIVSSEHETQQEQTQQKQLEYGVFIGETEPLYDLLKEYETIVIDAEYFSKEQIQNIKDNGCKQVFSYLNLGSIENFRDYYDDFEEIFLGDYENWPEEKWVDVSDCRWQEHIVSRAKSLYEKGVDGFFIDNCDVYYVYPEERIYTGLVQTLSRIKELNTPIIINGGDMFVTRTFKENDESVFDGVNQESVYTAIDFEKETFKRSEGDVKEYFTEYLKSVKLAGKEVYVLEYCDDETVRKEVLEFSNTYGFTVYISRKLGLTYD